MPLIIWRLGKSFAARTRQIQPSGPSGYRASGSLLAQLWPTQIRREFA